MKSFGISSGTMSFWDVLFCLFLVVSSGSLFSTDYPYALYGIVGVFCILVIKGQIFFTPGLQKVLIVLSLLMVLSIFQFLLFADGDDVTLIFKNFLLLFTVFCVAFSSPEKNLPRFRTIAIIILFFSVISNSIYLYHIFVGGLNFSITPTSENSMHFYYLEQICGNTLIGLEFRNGGIYYEPGMYQIYLNFALLYVLYASSFKYRLLTVIYLLLTIVSTFSVSGYATAAIIIVLFVLKNNYKGLFTKLLLLITIVGVFVAIAPFLKESLEIKAETSSYETRNNDLTIGLEVFITNPIFGYGIVNHEYAKVYGSRFNEKRESSNGMANLLISFGLIGAILVAICITGMNRWLSFFLSKKVILGFLVWLGISINTESIILHPVFFLILAVGAHSYLKGLTEKKQLNKSMVTAE